MFTDKRHKSAELTSRIMNELYNTRRDGLSGNEDCGQMSAWYVFSALGFYPVTPGEDYYVYGTPLFTKAVIDPGNGRTFTVSAERTSAGAIYPSQITVNGTATNKFIRNQEILNGGKMHFKLSDKADVPAFEPASKAWTYNITPSPYLVSGPKAFTDSCSVELKCVKEGAVIKYTLDPSADEANWKVYSTPFTLHASSSILAKAYSKDADPSFPEEVSFIRLPYKRSIAYTNKYSHLYTAGGPNGLIDGIRGEPEVFGSWQGFEGTDLEVVIDLGEIRPVSGISTGFLQQYPSWIWLPLSVKYEVSDDGKTFRTVYEQKTTEKDNTPGSFVRSYDSGDLKERARYVRVSAVNRKICPPWHPGAGFPCWIFADEVEIR
jgi:hypothetical protein